MARLIPQKQIEEVNQFRDSISVGNSVFISGSLLVSQSIDFGTLASDKQRITGSVEITGSLQIDGALSFANATSRLDVTSSFSDVSVDTQRFGGILVKDFAKSNATIYVSSTNGDDNNSGDSAQFPLRTIKRAAQIATPGDDGRYGLPTGSLFSGFRLSIDTGIYVEDNPIELPRNTTVWGSGLRVTKIVALNQNEDLFWVNSGCYLAEMTFAGLSVYPNVDDSQKGFAIAFAPNAFITTSPYIQNCSMISNQENSFLELYEEIPAGGGGLNVDGNKIHPNSPLASMVLDAYTQVSPNGVGCQVVGRGFIQLVSFFTNFSAYSVKVIDGGHAVLLNSNTSFGDYGMYASGSRYITGSGGNTTAFLNVQDNYSIIVNTISNGLSAIPALVPNTINGIRVTDPNIIPQYFVSEESTAEVAEIVKSDFRLISSIIDTGVLNTPSLIAKSGISGYSPQSVYNISGQSQYTSSITASSYDISIVDANFDLIYTTLQRGNIATESYERISNTSNLIKITNVVPYTTTQVDSTTIDRTDISFNIITSIIGGGVSPKIVSNTSSNFKFTEVTQYVTDITASLPTISAISASFSIVYDTIEYGTGDLPLTILSSSTANTSSEIENAYNLLINNIPFIQSETISYISSSWSEFEYNEASFSYDIGYIVSGAAYDILYGGNEESIRNAQFYSSKDITTQLEPTLNAVKYASGVAQNLLKGREYITASADIINGYDIITKNTDFIKAEVIEYISSSWSEFEYNEVSCSRDIGYILDAVATDLKYKGNERSVIAGKFYFRYPSLATSTQLTQTLDGIGYAKQLTEKLLNNTTFVVPSGSVIGAVELIRQNRSLIQTETITYINTQYPNLEYNQPKFKQDIGYIVDNITTDLLYGGNERSETAGLYYSVYPLFTNTTQLTQAINAIEYVSALTNIILISEILPTPKIGLNIDNNIKVTQFNTTSSLISATNTEITLVSQSFGIIEDIIRYGVEYIPSAIADNSNIDWSLINPINVSNLIQLTSSLSNQSTESISDNFNTIVKIIESGSSVITEQTVGTDRNGAPISTVGIPKNSYGDNLITTVIGTIIPAEIELVKNTEAGIKFGTGSQITSLTSSAGTTEIQKVSSSFSIVADIIKYGISGSLNLSGSSQHSTYYEVVSFESENYLFNENQLNKFDNTFTASIEDGIIDPTLTLKRGELYTFSVNSLNIINIGLLEIRPFYIKTDIKPGDRNQYRKGVTNNGTTFGTLTFIVPFDAPDTLYYVNGNDIQASGIINIVDELPIYDTQRYIEIPSLGDFEVVTNNIDNIKVTDTVQIQSIYTASISESLSVSSSFATTIDILLNGVGNLPTTITNISGLVKKSTISQYTSSIESNLVLRNNVSSSFANILNIITNGTGSIPTEIENVEGGIKFNSLEQFTSSLSASLEDITFVSNSISIVSEIIANGSGSYLTASLYGVVSTEPSTLAAYEIIKENIPFIQSETLSYLSSSWSTASYNEASCSIDIGLIISGAAEDLLYNTISSSIVNGKYYLEFPSAAQSSQLNQTLDGVEYASKLTQKLIQNIVFETASIEVLTSYNLIRKNREFVESETISYVSSSWSGFDYNESLGRRDIGYIIDAVSTDLLYGGNERSNTVGVLFENNQLDSTLTGINYVKGIVNELLQNNVFVTASAQTIGVSNLIIDNKLLVQNEVIAYISSSWSNLEYNEASCSRDVGYILDSVVTDFYYGGNERTITAGEFYYLFPSAATVSGSSSPSVTAQLYPTLDGVTYAQRLTNKIINNTTLVTASLERETTYNLLLDNKSLIQTEVISFMSSSWSGFEYIDSKCKRDVGYIVDAVATDTLYGGNERSVTAGEFYYLYPSKATSVQSDQTITGINHAFGLADKIIQNILLVNATTEVIANYEVILENKDLIQTNVIYYIDSLYPYFTYNRVKCRRDVGHIIDAIATDLLWGGNERSIVAADYYYRYPSEATTIQLGETTEAIQYANSIVNKLIQNSILYVPTIILNTDSNIKFTNSTQITGSGTTDDSVLNVLSSSFGLVMDIITNGTGSLPTISDYTTPLTDSDTLEAYSLIKSNIPFIQNEVIAYISSAWSGFEYNEASCSRDVGLIVSGAAEDLLFGSVSASVVNAKFYFEYPSAATGSQIYQTLDGIKYAAGLSNKIAQSILYVTASNEVSASWHLLRDNKEFIQNEVISYVSSSWSGVFYNEDKCKRDVGYLIDASATDLFYGGNERSVNAGSFYYLFPSAATQNGVPSTTSQLDPTIDGIIYASGLSQKVIQNVEFVQPTSEVLVGAELLIGNRTFIQTEVIEYLSSSWSEFYYNEASCSRDIGYIIDATRTDLVYGGNERSIKAGTFYYYIPSVATTKQKPQTLDGINFAKGMAEKVINKFQLTRPLFQTRTSVDYLRASKKVLQASAISYTAGAFPNFVYNEEKCYRDTGFIVDAIATDLLYGGNERSSEAASSYYNGVYGSAATVINEQKYETSETNRFLRTQFQRIVRNSPVEEFGSLIITTGHDFSYAGAGVTYKALPPNQGGAGVADPDKEITEIAGGRVFFTSGNELGDFRIGTGLVINQATGTLQGRTFSRSLFSLVTPFSLALEG